MLGKCAHQSAQVGAQFGILISQPHDGTSSKSRKTAVSGWENISIGRDERIRTSDPHTPSVMRYQAALRPDRGCAYMEVDGAWQVVCAPVPTFPVYGFRCAFAECVIGARIIRVGGLGLETRAPAPHMKICN